MVFQQRHKRQKSEVQTSFNTASLDTYAFPPSPYEIQFVGLITARHPLSFEYSKTFEDGKMIEQIVGRQRGERAILKRITESGKACYEGIWCLTSPLEPQVVLPAWSAERYFNEIFERARGCLKSEVTNFIHYEMESIISKIPRDKWNVTPWKDGVNIVAEAEGEMKAFHRDVKFKIRVRMCDDPKVFVSLVRNGFKASGFLASPDKERIAKALCKKISGTKSI